MKKERDVKIEIVRFFAFIMVLTTHFLSLIGTPQAGSANHFIITLITPFTYVCVPFFLMITGYLQGTKEISFDKKYLTKLSVVLVPYAVVIILMYPFFKYFLGYDVGFFQMLFSFSWGYSWYVEMYTGLFLLIPFINIIYKNLKNKKHKQYLMIALFLLVSVPKAFNIFGKYCPSFFLSLYPLLYYFIGAYIKEFGVEIKKKLLVGIYALCSILYGVLMYFLSLRNISIAGIWSYSFPLIVIASVSLFIVFIQTDFSKVKGYLKSFILKVAPLTFTAYLFSCITDNFLKGFLQIYGAQPLDRLVLYIPFVILNATLTLTVAKLINTVSNPLIKRITK